MPSLETIVVAFLVFLLVLTLGLLLAWRLIGGRGRALSKRVSALPLRQQVQLAGSVFGDPRMPAMSRVVLAFLILYLASPLDLIPDFVPVIGQVDDIVMIALGGALLLKTAPAGLLEEHLQRFETEAPRP